MRALRSRDRTLAVWQKGLELVQATLEADPGSIGMRLFQAALYGFLGERTAFEREESSALAALDATPDLNPYELLHLVGAHTHLGDTERALEILRRQLRDGRLMGLGFVGRFAPTLLDTPGFADFRLEHEAKKQRLRQLYVRSSQTE